MEEMKWFSSSMLGVLAANNLGFAWLWPESAIPFWPAAVPRRHGMSKISHTEPSHHCNITHRTHMEEMKCFSSAMLGVLAMQTTLVLLGCHGWDLPSVLDCSAKETWHVQNQPDRASSTL
jgi:hypothetical protein